jgi:hypothetical protein
VNNSLNPLNIAGKFGYYIVTLEMIHFQKEVKTALTWQK